MGWRRAEGELEGARGQASECLGALGAGLEKRKLGERWKGGDSWQGIWAEERSQQRSHGGHGAGVGQE